MRPSTPDLDHYVEPAQRRAALEADVRAGLTADPRTLPPKWFYDARGSQLFDQITRLPEYYPTRCEKQVLTERAGEIAALTQADTLVELGSGTSEKTRLLLDALLGAGTLTRFVPFDVDASILEQAGEQLTQAYPSLSVQGVVGDFEQHLGRLPTGGRRLVAFLGGTIGNLLPDQRAAFLAELAATLAPGDALLLGTDLVKEPGRLVRAYDDEAGVTGAFNLNVLHVLVAELDAELSLDDFAHEARWNADQEWVEMHLRAVRDTVIRVLDVEVAFRAGQSIRTEVSAKFRREGVERELAQAGLTMQHWWTDVDGDYAVSLSVRR